jgi:hypothetical protein
MNRSKALARSAALGAAVAASLVLAAASLVLAATPASGEKPTRDNNCVHPSGVSFNELFDVPEQFVNPVCTGLTAGEHWRSIIGD